MQPTHDPASRPVAAWRSAASPERPADGHEAATLDALARRIAHLMARDYAGAFDADDPPPPEAYLVPEATLVRADMDVLHPGTPDDLFGGVVPHRFVATKLVSHPAVRGDADVPLGWEHALAPRLAQAVLPGYAVFRADDAATAFDWLAPLGPMRFKLARGIGGNGQRRIETREDLDAALADLPEGELERHGASLEQDLRDATTYSIGTVECAGMRIAYHGHQYTTRGPDGHEVYAGSELEVVRGGLDDLLAHVTDLSDRDPERAALVRVVRQARRYDCEMQRAFPGFFASRRNYDVVVGRDAGGTQRSGVLEQSWRIGGASPAELLAMEALASDQSLRCVRAACHEAYGDCTPPADARVHFDGEDPRYGRMVKYARLVPAGEGPRGHAA